MSHLRREFGNRKPRLSRLIQRFFIRSASHKARQGGCMDQQTFIIDCPFCKAKVAAIEQGSGTYVYSDDDFEPVGTKLIIGSCPNCRELLVGKTNQIAFEGYEGADRDRWSRNVVRVYPNPQKTFRSLRIPQSALESLSDADRSLQAKNMLNGLNKPESLLQPTLAWKRNLNKYLAYIERSVCV